MDKLMLRIDNELKEFGHVIKLMGNEIVEVTLTLNAEEIQTFKKSDFDNRYTWKLEENVLVINYIKKTNVYVEDLGVFLNIEKLAYEFGRCEKSNDEQLYQINYGLPNGLSDDQKNWVYVADAIDEKGNLYLITWKELNFGKDNGDGICTWKDYIVTKR